MIPGKPSMHALNRNPLYPDSDGKPMADNTLQYEWIVRLKDNLDHILSDFVAGNILWYAVEGEPTMRMAPDVLVALGRPKGYRGSYQTWREDGVVPQVLFEVLSPGNRLPEMHRKLRFYERHGVEEYYILDPENGLWTGWRREQDHFIEVDMHGHVSPRLQIRFEHDDAGARVYRPDGTPFRTSPEVHRAADELELEKEARRCAEARVRELESRLAELD